MNTDLAFWAAIICSQAWAASSSDRSTEAAAFWLIFAAMFLAAGWFRNDKAPK